MECKIRYATYEDAKLANSFLTKLIQDEKKYDENINENCIVHSLYENLIQDEETCLLVAEVENELIGYLYGFIQNTGDSCIEPVAWIDAMFVDEEKRCKGIATQLIEEFKKWSSSKVVSYIELKVCNNNHKAISLYKKNGFDNVKTIMKIKLDK